MNVGIHVTRAATFFKDQIAIMSGPHSRTFRQLEERTNRLAHALVSLGIQKRDRVALILPNSTEWIESDFAIAKAGGMTVPIGNRLHEREMAHMISVAEPRVIITNTEVAPRLSAMLGSAGVAWIIVGGTVGSAPGTVYNFEELMTRGSPDHICVPVDEALDGRVMRFTSGTTGKPKGVYLTHRNWLAIAHNTLLDRWSLHSGDLFLGCSPYPHAGGLWILPALIRGAAVHIYDKFDPDQLLDYMVSGRATVVQLVPTVLRRLLDVPGIREHDLSRLKALHYGGAPIENSTLTEALEVFGPKLVQGYGLNEAGIICTLQTQDHLKVVKHSDWHQPLGREVTMAEIRLLNADGVEVPVGETGELTVRGPMVLKEYWNNPEATGTAIRDGFLNTGDLAMRGEDGYLYLAGRSKDIIVTGGYNVSPDEVESVLDKHPAVHQCAVVGLPHRDWGEQVTAFVRLKPGFPATEADLVDFCRDYLTSYKKPKEIRFVEELPVNNNGKVVRRILRERYSHGLGFS